MTSRHHLSPAEHTKAIAGTHCPSRLSLYDWTYTHTCELTGAQPVVDMEVELGIEATISDGSLDIEVGAVWQGHASLFMGDDFTKRLAAIIVSAAEKEIADGGWLYQQICEREGFAYVGMGGNDPDGRWVEAAE